MKPGFRIDSRRKATKKMKRIPYRFWIMLRKNSIDPDPGYPWETD